MSVPTDVAGSGVAEESSPGLLRALGLGSATAIVVGGVIGSGIFTGPSKIAAEVGSFPLILSAWAAGGLLCLLGALCIAELAAMLPRAGGIYVYLREAYGGATASSFAVSEYLFGRPASIGALAVFFVILVTDAFKSVGLLQESLSIPLRVAAAIAVIGLVAWINMMGVVWGGRLQSGATLIKAGFLGGLAILPFLLTGFGVEHALTLSNYTSTISAAQPTFAAKVAAAMLPILWAYNGWHDVAPVAEEIRHPERNIPLALLLGVLALIGLYCGANLAYHGVLSMEQIADPQAIAAKNTAQQMLATLLRPLGPNVASWGAAAMSATMLCGVFGTLTVNVLLGPRIAFAMGRDDFCFRQLGTVHPRWRTPVVSILVQCTMSAVLVVLAAIAAEYREGLDIFNLLTDCVVVVASPYFMLCAMAVWALRRKHPEWVRPYRVWGYPVVPAVFLAAYAWLMWHIVQAKPFEACVSVGMVLPGIPMYYAWQIWGRQKPQRDDDQLELLGMFYCLLGSLEMCAVLIPLCFVGAMVAPNLGNIESHQSDAAAATFGGNSFVFVGFLVAAAICAKAGCMIYAGRCLRTHHNRTFPIVMSVITCLSFPLGTALGVWTLVVLSRPAVRALFERQQLRNTE